jgi:hypothetical protein
MIGALLLTSASLWVALVQVTIVRVAIVLGGNFMVGNHPGC